jgi:alcohol dehydrogenase class IV
MQFTNGSPLQFTFATASQILFGEGTFEKVAELVAGSRTLLVTGGGSTADAAARLESQLRGRDIEVTRFSVRGEPNLSLIHSGIDTAHTANVDNVIGLGGGSVLDSAKAFAGLLTNPGEVTDYLEVIGTGKPITQPALPLILIPTTAGTGSEVTRNAVISVPDKGIKVSLRSPLLLPRYAVVDPTLQYTLPPDVTASTGLDALTQLIEAYTSSKRTPITDALCRGALERAIPALPLAYFGEPEYSQNYSQSDVHRARAEMAYAALCSGIALANAGLGAVHGFAAALGGRYPIAHGVCCAVMLPHVVGANIDALIADDPARHVELLTRYEEIARWFGLKSSSALSAHLTQLVRSMAIPGLSALGVQRDDFPALAEASARSNSMKGNPIPLPTDKLVALLDAAWN